MGVGYLKQIFALPISLGLIACVSILSQSAFGTIDTSTSISSSQNPSEYGQPLTITATVMPSNGTIPDGETLTFLDSNATIGNATTSNDTATFDTSSLSLGSHNITAVYSGDTNYTTSTSGALSQLVNQSTTSTYISSSADPSVPGQAVTFSATVYPSNGIISDGETVTFLDGNITIGTAATSSGTAAFTTSSLSLGDHTITAAYPGDGNFTASTSNAQIQTVAQTTTSTYIYSSANPSLSGKAITFSATVYPYTGTIPDGETVTFLDGNTTIGNGTITSSTATLTTSALSLGSHTITVVYSGDTSNAASNSTITQTIVRNSTTTITSSQNPSTYPQSITFTATVLPPNATGTVQFAIDGTNVGSQITVSGGTASYASLLLPVGSHTVVATYLGDANYATSTSTVLSQTVNTNPNQIMGTATKCSGLASCTYAISGGSASASAFVGGYVGQSPLLFYGGSVRFQLPNETTATYATGVYGGKAVLSGFSSTAGTLYTVTGQFFAIDSNTGKLVTGTTQDVIGIKGHSGRGGGIYFTLVNGSIAFVATNFDGTQTTVACNPSSVQSGKTSTCTVTVADTASASNVPTGTVTLLSSNTGIGSLSSSSCTLSSGSCSVSFKTNQESGAGTTSIHASYPGDNTHYVSSASTLLYATSPVGSDDGGD